MLARPLLLYGHFEGSELGCVERAAEASACSVSHVDSLALAEEWLEHNTPQAVLCRSEDAEGFAVQTRGRAQFSRLPLLALSQHLSDLEFVSAFSWGADDLVSVREVRPLVARLRALPKELPPLPTEHRGEALIAEPDRMRRTAVARVLRNAGFKIRFAVAEEDAVQFAQAPELSLVVLNHEMMPDATSHINRARASGSQARFILCGAPRHLRELRGQLNGLSGVTVADAFTAPEDVLFVANELTSGRSSGRTSPRVPFGTQVLFRGAGRDVDEHGFSYNVSASGLYVRTLAPPEDDDVWLELTPPRLERRVRLVGRVAWRRPFNFNENATVPPGFGLQIVDGATQDRSVWAESFARLLKAVG